MFLFVAHKQLKCCLFNELLSHFERASEIQSIQFDSKMLNAISKKKCAQQC